ncbi:ribonuclease H-like domain-containing protein [Tanacetum coccineum]
MIVHHPILPLMLHVPPNNTMPPTTLAHQINPALPPCVSPVAQQQTTSASNPVVGHSMTQPLPEPFHNVHPMVTHVKSGISKPLERMSLSVVIMSPFPKSFSHAIRNTNWKNVMLEEYNALITNGTWPIHQFDVKNAFLHGHLSKTVYMHQPLGFIDPVHPDYVCHLQRSLYGLKQALCARLQRFSSYATRVSFQHSKTDSSLFIFHRGTDISYLLLYIDDIILASSPATFLQRVIRSLHVEFSMNDLGSLNYFLAILA